VVLDGSNIDFVTPGTFTVKAATHDWAGGASGAAVLPNLPVDLSKLKPNDLLLDYQHSNGEAVQGAPYEVTFSDGSKRSGMLDSSGRALINGVPTGIATVKYGEDARRNPEGSDTSNPLDGWM
jgi:type VI secretion system secreted protein VgrG